MRCVLLCAFLWVATQTSYWGTFRLSPKFPPEFPLVVDEGTDAGSGIVMVDNILINKTVIGKQ